MEAHGNGVFRQWSDEGQIVIFIVRSSATRETVDTLLQLAVETGAQWPQNKPVLCLFDYSEAKQGVTPYSQQRAEEVYQAIPFSTQVYSASVISDPVTAWMADLLLRSRLKRGKNVVERVFSDKESALEWLRQFVQS